MTEHGPTWHLQGKVVADPFADYSGDEIPIIRIAIPESNGTSRPDWVQNWDFFEGALLTVVIRDGDSHKIEGTAVMIAPGLAVTASHVFAEHVGDIGAGTSALSCFGHRSTGVDVWKVTNIVSDVDRGDLAFLSLELASPVNATWRFTEIGITTRCPKPGEILSIFGYRFEEADTGADVEFTFKGNLFVASGTVVAVYPVERHPTLMPFPAIELDCGSLGGMSGGAVLDPEGLLVGVISRGLKTDDLLGPTYAAWIVGGFNNEFTLPWPPGLYGDDPVHLLGIPEELLGIVGRDAITIDDATNYRYRVWFE